MHDRKLTQDETENLSSPKTEFECYQKPSHKENSGPDGIIGKF